MAGRWCLSCDKFKPLSDFHRDSKGSEGFRSRCKVCTRSSQTLHRQIPQVAARNAKYQVGWRQDNKNAVSIRSKQYRKDLKTAALRAYGGETPKCSCPGCSEINPGFLTIDHIDGNGNKHRRSIFNGKVGGNIYLWLKKNNYPPGFRILCYNCNCAAGALGQCPHMNSELR